MRGRGKYWIWPAYFNINFSRSKGRRVSREIAIHNPSIGEIEKAAIKLGLEPILVPEAIYPKQPWIKTGMLMVNKNYPKEQILNKIAKKMRNKN
jgi:signal recognition particle subunit SRP19